MTPAEKNIIVSRILASNNDKLLNQIADLIAKSEQEETYIYYDKRGRNHVVISWTGGKKKYIGSRLTRTAVEDLKRAYDNSYTHQTLTSKTITGVEAK